MLCSSDDKLDSDDCSKSFKDSSFDSSIDPDTNPAKTIKHNKTMRAKTLRRLDMGKSSEESKLGEEQNSQFMEDGENSNLSQPRLFNLEDMKIDNDIDTEGSQHIQINTERHLMDDIISPRN